MKLCWDNLEKLRYNKNTGRWYEYRGIRSNGKKYQYAFEYKDNCLNCNKPVSHNPIISADVDNCITLCKSHHIEEHKKKGMRYSDLWCR